MSNKGASMTTWKQFEQDMMDYLDGLLSTEKRKEIDKRLADDAEALQLFNSLSALKAQLRGLKRIKTSPDFDTVLRTRIRMEKSLSRRSLFAGDSRASVFALAGALAVLAVVLAMNVSNSDLKRPYSNKSPLPASVVTSFSRSQQDSGSIQRARINYPMEMVRLPQGGTRLESDARRGVTTASDSSRNSLKDQIVTVEF